MQRVCLNVPQIRSVLSGKMKGTAFSNLGMFSTIMRQRKNGHCPAFPRKDSRGLNGKSFATYNENVPSTAGSVI